MTYSYRNGQRASEHNYSVCLKVRELFCPESPCQHYQCSPIMPHSLFHFCLCSEYLCVSRKKKKIAFAFQSGFLSLKAVQEKFHMMLFCQRKLLQKTQDIIGCLLLQPNDNQPRYWLFQFPLVFHLTVLGHLLNSVTYLITTVFSDVHHDPVRY